MKEYIERDKIYDTESLLMCEMAKEIVHGKWIKMVEKGCYWYACSKCGHDIPKNQWGTDWFSDWCPNCGARMYL